MFFDFYSKIEGSKATAKLTAEVLRSFISQKRLPHTNQADALIEAVKAVGEELIDANPVGKQLFYLYLQKSFNLINHFNINACIYTLGYSVFPKFVHSA